MKPNDELTDLAKAINAAHERRQSTRLQKEQVTAERDEQDRYTIYGVRTLLQFLRNMCAEIVERGIDPEANVRVKPDAQKAIDREDLSALTSHARDSQASLKLSSGHELSVEFCPIGSPIMFSSTDKVVAFARLRRNYKKSWGELPWSLFLVAAENDPYGEWIGWQCAPLTLSGSKPRGALDENDIREVLWRRRSPTSTRRDLGELLIEMLKEALLFDDD